MATYYVNFDSSATSGNGASGTPFNWDNFISDLAGGGNNYYCRGSHTLSADLSGAGGDFELSAWSLSAYGPWRIDGGGYKWDQSAQNISLHGGILYNIDDGEVTTVENMFVYNTGTFEVFDTASYSTLVMSENIKSSGGNWDSNVYYVNSGRIENVSAGAISARYGVTNADSLSALAYSTSGGSESATDMTYNVAMGYVPVWNETNLSFFKLGVLTSAGPSWATSAAGSFSDFGHIGAFYFGPVSTTVSAGVLEISAVLLSPDVTVVNAVSTSAKPNIIPVKVVLLQPTVYAFQDIEVSFVGIPRCGPGPLTVDFTATVKFSKDAQNKYRVKQYVWCFDYNDAGSTCNIAEVTTTQNTVSHVYTGYYGQKFSVKCNVTLELIT